MADTEVAKGASSECVNRKSKSESPINSNTRGQNRHFRRPNYARIHEQRLPLRVHPLPAFIPHNPLSLVRIAFALVSEFYYRPTALEDGIYRGYFSAETRSVHVTDPATVRALWEKGFFGKGSLSRSEPTWLEAELRRLGDIQDGSLASEELTRQRRNERIEMKRERARLAAEAIEYQLREEAATIQNTQNVKARDSASPTLKPIPPQSSHRHNGQVKSQKNAVDNSTSVQQATEESEALRKPSKYRLESVEKTVALFVPERPYLVGSEYNSHKNSKTPFQPKTQEHLQISLEEAFFLSYALGALQISNPDNGIDIMDSRMLLQLFRQHSYFPPKSSSSLRPDDSFLLRYVVYHHFRSLGWVVRDGIKFAVDYLLYERGVVFKHAEFAIVIVPSYTHDYWRESRECRRDMENKQATKNWHWLHCVLRVQTQVTKTLVLVYVDVPPPEDIKNALDVGKILQRYKVREFCVKRFSTNRNR